MLTRYFKWETMSGISGGRSNSAEQGAPAELSQREAPGKTTSLPICAAGLSVDDLVQLYQEGITKLFLCYIKTQMIA
jgi:hypothetical protein